MAKLITFGDSFSTSSNNAGGLYIAQIDYDTCWPYILAEKLKVTKLQDFSICGCSNEYIFYHFFEYCSKNINSTEDFIIIQTTHRGRRWWFKDRPDAGNAAHTVFQKGFLSNNEINALKQYVKFLCNDNLDEVMFTMFVYAVMYIAANRKVLILSGFHNSPNCIGNLNEVSSKEYINEEVMRKNYKQNEGRDFRINHLSLCNRSILADKIFNFFQTQQTIDLTKDFVTNIYTSPHIGKEI